jgi:hypothetical protein
MALLNSQALRKEQKMKLEIASEDIVQKNALGQSVVVVPAGQPIPEGLDVSSKTVTEESADGLLDTPTSKRATRSRNQKA